MNDCESVALSMVASCADTWKLPLIDVLTSHGHDHECDKVLTDGVAECDCWWQQVWNALKGMEDTADLARTELASRTHQ